MKYVSPNVREASFSCPYCGTLTTQFWYSIHADRLKPGNLPTIVDEKEIAEIDRLDLPEESKDSIREFFSQMMTGRPFLERKSTHRSFDVNNLWLSRCYNCDQLALWLTDRMIYPLRGEAPPANSDLPAEVRSDYDEASAILEISPRGSAALVRLAIQKLCVHLGEPGKNLNEDIAALVAKGLDRRVQMALDAVRVIGNNAVHPGQIQLQDDRATAETLFGLVNLIAEKMISEPKHVEEVYAKLPQGAREAIDRRDGK